MFQQSKKAGKLWNKLLDAAQAKEEKSGNFSADEFHEALDEACILEGFEASTRAGNLLSEYFPAKAEHVTFFWDPNDGMYGYVTTLSEEALLEAMQKVAAIHKLGITASAQRNEGSHKSVEIDVYFNITGSSDDVKGFSKLLKTEVLPKFKWIKSFEGEYVDADEDADPPQEWWTYLFDLDEGEGQDFDALWVELKKVMKAHHHQFPDSEVDISGPNDWTYDGQL
jgi:hypothetical protein